MKTVVRLAILMLLCAPAQAQRPLLLSYQAVLADAQGAALPDGPITLHFALYEAATGGAPVWTETQELSIEFGVLNAHLGVSTPLTPAHFEKQLWLGITVGEEPEMTPRAIVSVSPYAAAMYDTDLLGLGDTCAANNECDSSYCADSVCCDKACDGVCVGCGDPAGSCVQYPRGTDPEAECGPYTCSGGGSCLSSCVVDGDCMAAFYCNGQNACVQKKTNGAACAADSECLSGDCVDGYCCNSPCSASCDRCDSFGSEGVCTLSQPGWPGEPTCGNYLCNGTTAACPSSCTADADCAYPAVCGPDNQCIVNP